MRIIRLVPQAIAAQTMKANKNQNLLLILGAIFGFLILVAIPLLLLKAKSPGSSSTVSETNLSFLPAPAYEELELTANPKPKDFRGQKKPSFRLKSKMPLPQFKKAVKIVDARDEPAAVSFEITQEGEDKIIKLQRETQFKPGAYKIKISQPDGSTYEQDFTWGVLAINTDRSSYLPGENAQILMTVLDNIGETVCQADITLVVVSPSGKEAIFSSQNGKIEKSDECRPKNVTYKADFKAIIRNLTEEGIYRLLFQAKIEDGLRQVEKKLLVDSPTNPSQKFVVYRQGPTRIYPPSPFNIQLKILAHQDFSGKIIEKVPADFEIRNTRAKLETKGNAKTLTWETTVKKGESLTLEYQFKAPNISPEFYLLGPLEFVSGHQLIFSESRSWQIAADADPNLIVFTDSSPASWTCISDGAAEAFYEKFPRGNSSYGGTGGTATHTHKLGLVSFSTGSECLHRALSGGGMTQCSHTHSISSSSCGSASNLPSFKNLKVINYTAGGIPSALPDKAIVMFDAAVPTGFTRYSAQDTYYIRGRAGTASGGSNTHTHSVSFTTGLPSVAKKQSSDGPILGYLSSSNHTHTGSGNSASVNHEPPKITVVLVQANSATSYLPWNMFGMFDSTPSAPWEVESNPGDDFYQKFFQGSATPGTITSPSTSHTHSNLTIATSAASDSLTMNCKDEQGLATTTHTHNVIYSFDSSSHLPPYRDVIVAKLIAYPPANCYVVESTSDDHLTVHWSDLTSYETHFQIDRSVDGGAFAELTNSVSANATSYEDKTTSSDHTYAYRVRAEQGSVTPQVTDWCTTLTYDTLKGGFKFEGVKMEGVKINYRIIKNKFLALLTKLTILIKNIIIQGTYASTK